MVAPIREIPVSAGESTLPGGTRPRGFKGQSARPGGPGVFDWWVTFVDDDGAIVPSGTATATIQWYGVNVEGEQVSTPSIGDAVEAAQLAVDTIAVGDKLWPWPIATAMTAPGGATKLRIYLTPSAAG